MAKFDTIYLDGGDTQSAVNIHEIVGTGGVNRHDDVMLIQALFNYIGKQSLGLGPDYNMPGVTGDMDADTYSAIGEFQMKWLSHLMIKTFDGRIHPASYKNRKLNLFGGPRPLMAITLLHVLAGDAALMNGDYSYPQTLASKHAELAKYLDSALMGL